MTEAAKILIVEDDGDLNSAYQLILKSAGYDVSCAENGKQALEVVAKDGNPDIILLDLRMPVMGGIGFLKNYQPHKHPEVTIVVFSNYDAQKEVDEAYQLGAHRYVLKARAAPKELLRIVEDVLDEKNQPAS